MNLIPVAHGQAAVGVMFATVNTRSLAVAVPEIVLDAVQAPLAMLVCVMVKLPATVAVAGNDTVPVVKPAADQFPVAVADACRIVNVTSSFTLTPAV
ncbi:MAG: hypothetical protein EPO35_05160 [Acidobacteria bacterium]|nr:MAG: hypothetical protein EPO35_05160 [Acidobacteriota bacterium]